MLNNLIDMHLHLLPEVDDGATSMQEMCDAIDMAQQSGISTFIFTPHLNVPWNYASTEQVQRVFERVKIFLAEKKPVLSAYLGQECMYHNELVNRLDQKDALTLAGSRYVLVQFWEDSPYAEIKNGCMQLMDHGYMPILAHYERYKELMNERNKRDLKQEGILLQMNFDTVQRSYGIRKTNPFRADLQHGIVDFMGSDCHGTHFRRYQIVPSLIWMERNLDQELVEKILIQNPKKILTNEY